MKKFIDSVLLFLALGILFAACKNETSIKISEKYIGIQPFYSIKKNQLVKIEHALETIYNKKVIVFENLDLPNSAFINIKSPRYRADSLLKFIARQQADSIALLLGITSHDISTTKRDKFGNVKKPLSKYEDWGVFGLGYCPGNSCIVSVFRIQHKNESLFTERLTKICVHEVGHNFGLPHCADKNCVMTDACESIKTVDNVQLSLCEACNKKIK